MCDKSMQDVKYLLGRVFWAVRHCARPSGDGSWFRSTLMYSPGVHSHRGNKRRAEPTKQFIPFSAFRLRYQFNICYGPCAALILNLFIVGERSQQWLSTGVLMCRLGVALLPWLGALQPKQSYKFFEFEMKWNWNQKAFHDTIAFMTVPWWSTETEYTSFGFWTFRWSFPFVLSRIENYL